MRKTEIPEELPRELDFLYRDLWQANLDAFWELIENHYEEEWRVEISGAVVLVVDDAMLERVLDDNTSIAWYKFGSYKGGDEGGRRFFLSRPEYLKGIWAIEGIYNGHQTYVGGERSYFFEPEA
jgi:hypothetical protein